MCQCAETSVVAGMSSSNDFSSNCGRKLSKTCLTASQLHTERNKPVLDGKASILHNKGTTVSEDLNLAESCRQTKTRNKKDKPQAANQRACLRKTSINGDVSSKFHETETSVPQQTTPKCPSKTSRKGRKKKNVQPSEKKAASKACSDRLDNSAHNSFLEQHLHSRKTKGTCYRHSKKTQNLSPSHHKILSSHTKTPVTPKRGRSRSTPLFRSTPNSDQSPKRAKNSSALGCDHNVKKDSLAKTPSRPQRARGRQRGNKNKNAQEQPNASPPVKRSRRRAMSPGQSPQEPSVEKQTPSMPCCETQEPNPKELGLHTSSTLFPHHDEKISSSHTNTPYTLRRGRSQARPLLSSTPKSGLQPLSPKKAKSSSVPRCHQTVKQNSLAKMSPADVKPQRPRGRPKGSKKRSVQEQHSASTPRKRSRRAMSPGESLQEEPFLKKEAPSRPNRKESEDQTMSSDLSIELSLQEEPVPVNRSLFMHEEEEDQDDDEEELPSFLQQDNRKPLSISKGLCVWCKLRKNPYWPAVVKSVNHKSKKASVLFIDRLINKERNRGFIVSLRTLKPFDCEDYEKLVHIAKEKYGDVITTSLELISDYRIRIGCGSFSGSFMEYCAADISYPVRMKYSEGKSVLTLPSQEILDELCDISDNNTDDIVVEEQDELLSKKVLPDRTKAARNRANKHLVDFITDRKVEKHLLAIISGHESSKWLQALQKPCRSVVEVYLEDEDQIDKVFRYLDKVCDNAPQINTCLENTQVDRIRLILDVLLPEAIIYAIAGVHKLSLEKAEEKYRKGPCFSNRERQAFDMMIEQQMKLKEVTQRSDSDGPSILNQN